MIAKKQPVPWPAGPGYNGAFGHFGMAGSKMGKTETCFVVGRPQSFI